jgi:hypothetical protein
VTSSARRGALVGAFFAIAAATIFRHEMWMDELNTWNVVRDSTGLRALFANMHLEVHPALWYLLLYPLTRLTSDPRSMQVLHLLIASASAAVVVWAAPFRLWQSALIIFGYFFVYEFAVISRGYALGLLAAVAACVVYCRPRPSPILLAALLAIVANTSFYGLILATALALGIAVSGRVSGRQAALAAVLYVAAATAAMVTLYPKADNAFAREWHEALEWNRVRATLSLIWAAYVPLPDFSSTAPWNSNILFGASSFAQRAQTTGSALLGAVLFGAGAVALRRDRAALVTYLAGSIAILAFVYLKYTGGLRHHGHLFVLLLLAVWMTHAEGPHSRPVLAAALERDFPTHVQSHGWWNALFVILLLTQAAAGAYFVVEDIRKPFSVSKELADFVRGLPPSSEVVVAHPAFLNYAGPVLSGYLQHPVPYILSHRIVRSSYMQPDAEHRAGASAQQIVAQARRLASDCLRDVYMVTNNWEPAELGVPLAHFDRHLEGDERSVDVYIIHPPDGGVRDTR